MAGSKEARLVMSLVDHVSGPGRAITAALAAMERQMRSIRTMTAGLGGIGGGFLAYEGLRKSLEFTVGEGLKFEESMANIRKVMEINQEQADNLSRSIRDMTKSIPLRATEIAEIYEAAGQANVPLEEQREFSEIVAQVATAWDATTESAGQALAEIKSQLQLTVGGVRDFADALNHLSNETAARTPDLVEYSKRVAATGEMYGFSAEQSLAFGSAMISGGAEAEVSATSFRNMGKALSAGTRATKSQREAFKRLGLSSVKTAKAMQKNAVATTLDVIDRIQDLPEWEQMSLATALFGDEARALMPLIRNSSELRRQLGLVSDRTKYAGSALREFIARSQTTGNVLKLLRNRFAEVGRSIGDKWLPTIKEGALELSDALDSLGDRAGVLSQIGAAFSGMAKGAGVSLDIRESVAAVSDLLLGPVDPLAGDRLGEIFARFEEFGRQAREFAAAVRESETVIGMIEGMASASRNIAVAVDTANKAIAAAWAEMQPVFEQIDQAIGGDLGSILGQAVTWGASLTVAAAGISIMAASVRSLAGALLTLSGAKAGASIIGSLAGLGGVGKGGKGLPVGKGGGKIGGLLGLVPQAALLAAGMYALKDVDGVSTPPEARQNDIVDWAARRRAIAAADARRQKDDDAGPAPTVSRFDRDAAAARAAGFEAEPTINFEALREFERSAVETGRLAQEALEINALPIVDTSSLDRAIAKASTFQSMLAGMSRAIGGGVASPAPATGPKFGGPRADGGPVSRGMAYLVGEQGPEIFAPGSSGSIVPNHVLEGATGAAGGGTTVHIKMNITGHGDAREIAKQVVAEYHKAMDKALSRSRQIALDGRQCYEWG